MSLDQRGIRDQARSMSRGAAPATDRAPHGLAQRKGRDLWYERNRLGGLRRFALAITVFNILGHTWFGFEPSWAQPLVGLAAAHGTEVLMELVDAVIHRRRPKFLVRGWACLDFFLPAQISGMAVSMLLYSNDRLMPIAFAAIVAIASKQIFKVMTANGPRHVFNPSNFGIVCTLLAFPWVGIAPPYHFSENLDGMGDWLLPAFIVVSGSLLNTVYTKRYPLLVAWLVGFAMQASLRHILLGTRLTGALMPMTGVAFILYTFYMVTDPPTTPSGTRAQILFGLAVAAVYGLLMAFHIVFDLFFALVIVSSIRGAYLYVKSLSEHLAPGSLRPIGQEGRLPEMVVPEPAPSLLAGHPAAFGARAVAEGGP